MSDRFAKFAAAAPDGESSGEEAKAAPSSPSRSAFANIRSRFEKKDGPEKGAAVKRASGNNAFASIRARFEKTPGKTTDGDGGGGVAGAQQEAPKKAKGVIHKANKMRKSIFQGFGVFGKDKDKEKDKDEGKDEDKGQSLHNML